MIDNKMNWTQHINYLNAKLCKGSWAISKLKKFVNIHTSKTIYYSLIYSHLKYCITSWGKVAKTIIQPIINTQKRITYIKQLSRDYINLLSEMPRYCCPIEIFYFAFCFIVRGIIKI